MIDGSDFEVPYLNFEPKSEVSGQLKTKLFCVFITAESLLRFSCEMVNDTSSKFLQATSAFYCHGMVTDFRSIHNLKIVFWATGQFHPQPKRCL